MNITGKNTGIRIFAEEDIVPFYEAARESIEHMKPFMPWCQSEYSIEESKDWVHSRIESFSNAEEYSFVIYSVKDKTILGGVEINQIISHHKFGNLGYWVRRNALNRGVATEAISLVVNYGFNTLGLERLEIVTLPDNRASRKVAEKVGAKYEGILQKRLSVYGKSRDACMYSLVKNI